MTNSLIPHSFVPGTKAKAQEVNANFIALAEEIQDTQSTMATRFAQVNSDITSVRNDVAANFSDIDMTNTKMLTDVILEGPNGVTTYNNQTITAKTGLRVLVPSGINSDGRYLTVDHTLSSDVSKTVTTFASCKTLLFLNINGTLDVVLKDLVFTTDTTNTTDGAYKYVNNKWYKYSSTESTWQEATVIPIAEIIWDSNNLISEVKQYPISKIVTAMDMANPSILSSILPYDSDFVYKVEYDSGVLYKYYKSGFVEICGYYKISPSVSVATRANTTQTVVLKFPIQDTVYANATPTSVDFSGALSGISGTNLTFAFKNIHSATSSLASFFWRCYARKQ